MPTFPDMPDLRIGPIVDDERTFIHQSDYHHPRGVIPAGSSCNGVSIPRILRFAYSVMGEALIASVIHDADYQNYQDAPNTREEADDAFFFNLIATGVSEEKACKFWYGVRIGAEETWLKHRGIEMPKPKRKPYRRRR